MQPVSRALDVKMIPFGEIENRWDKDNELMHILPLLEYEYLDAEKKVMQSSTLTNETLISLVLYALEFQSEYWGNLTLQWLDSEMEINTEISESLVTFSKDKRNTQSQRHRAFSLAKKEHQNASI